MSAEPQALDAAPYGFGVVEAEGTVSRQRCARK